MSSDSVRSDDILKQGKNIYYGIYGLLLTVIVVFALIFSVFLFQQAELAENDDLANNYHLAINENALVIINESENTRLWFRDHVVGSKDTGYEHQVITLLTLADKVKALDIVVDSRIKNIKQIHEQYENPEHEGIVDVLQKIKSQADKDLGDLLRAKSYSNRDIDEALFPLILITRQLQYLHEIDHSLLEEEQITIRNQYKTLLIGIGTLFLLLGLLVVIKLLRQVRHTLSEQVRMHVNTIENQERVQLLLDSTVEAICGVDMDGNCTFANTACLRMLGYELQEELLGRNLHVVLHHTRRDGELYPVEECKLHDARIHGEYTHASNEIFWRKDGTSIPVDYWSYPIMRNEEILGSVVTFMDITERLNVESALIHSEATMAEAQTIAHIGSWNWDIKTNELAWSDEIYRIFGANPQEFPATYDVFLEHIHPDDREAVTVAVKASLASHDVPYKVEHRIIREDSQERFIQEQGVVYRDAKDQPVRMIGTVLDITEKVISEQKLQKSQAEFSAVFESIPDAIIYANTKRRIQLVNSATLSLFGYPVDELFGKETKMLYAEEAGFDKTGLERFNENAKVEGLPYEMIYQRKDGSTFVGETLGTPVQAPNGKVLGFLGIVRDITERKQVENELEKYRDGLEELVSLRTKDLNTAEDELVRKERLATLGQLTATISHELRNPLGAMRPSLYVINKNIDPNNERLRQAVERVDRNISRCDHIIDELLDYTRVTNIDQQPHDLDTWLKNLVSEQDIPQEIKIETSFGLKERIVLFDSGRLQRAVINVIENACHAMTDTSGSELLQQDARLTVATQTSKDSFKIVISDNGTGISEEVLPKVFEPLFSTKGFGVGLGMPVVNQIMQQHGGGIEIDSKEGEGAIVTLWLPREQNKEATA